MTTLDLGVHAGGDALPYLAVGHPDQHRQRERGRSDHDPLRVLQVDAQVGEDELVVRRDAEELVGAGQAGLPARLQQQHRVVGAGAQQVVAVVGVRAGELGGDGVGAGVQGRQVGEEDLAERVPVHEAAVDGPHVAEDRFVQAPALLQGVAQGLGRYGRHDFFALLDRWSWVRLSVTGVRGAFRSS
jgi:hypothetical protein